MTLIPRLLYHNLAPALFPDGNGDGNVIVVRFASPVRLHSLRIVPEGVRGLSGIGSTYPDVFSARVLLNTTSADPVNALTPATIEYDAKAGGGWEQDYMLGMPDGIRTRMMMVVGKFDRLSLSIYGYLPDDTQGIVAASDEGIEVEGAEDAKAVGVESGAEDWSWISDWAGGVEGLVNLLDESDTSPNTSARRRRALECLTLQMAVEANPTVVDTIVNHPTALPYLLLLPSYPPQPILQRLFQDPKYALHPNVRHQLPPKHPCGSLAQGSDEARRRAALAMLPNSAAFTVLRELGPGEWDTEVKHGTSRLGILVQALEGWEQHSGAAADYEWGLDLLLDSIRDGGGGDVRGKYVARHLPRLIVQSRILGSSRHISLPDSMALEVVDGLLALPSVIHGQAISSIVNDLVKPYLAFEPFDRLFTAPSPQPRLTNPSLNADDRAVDRFAASLDVPTKPNAWVHDLTPTQLLSTIAPDLLASLATARDPPLGIRPIASLQATNGIGSASAFAGKVYSSHEFRTRDVGSTTSGPLAGGVATMTSGTGVGAAQLGAPGAGGLGVNAPRVSRPASRHVDDYAR